jgi:CHAT domain-containing protein/Tfp pilus assembly protein PilF
MKGINLFRISGISIALLCLIPLSLEGQSLTKTSPGKLDAGMVLRFDGRYAEAAQFFERHLSSALSEGNNRARLECGLHLGYLYWNMGKLDQSQTFFQESRHLAHILGLKMEGERSRVSLKIYRLYQKGKDLRKSRKFASSIQSFEEAISLAGSIHSREHELKCRRQLSLVYLDMNRLDEYFQLNMAGLELAEQLNHSIEEVRALNNIGHYFLLTKDYSQALGFFQRALSSAERQNISRDQAAIMNNIGLIYKDFGRIDRALFYQMKAMELNLEIGTGLDQAIGLNNIGNTYFQRAEITGERADLFSALYYDLECLDLSRELGSGMVEIYVLNNLAGIYAKLGRLDRAEAALREGEKKARAGGDSEALAMLLSNLGAVLLDKGLPEAAEEPLQEAQRLVGTVRNHRVVWETLFNRGRVFERRGYLAEALDYYRRAADIIQTVRIGLLLDVHQAGFMQTETGVYEHLLWLLYRLWKSGRVPGQAVFDVVEQAKARGFLDIVASARSGKLHRIKEEFAEREKGISSRITRNILSLSDPALTASESRSIKTQLRRSEEEYEALLSLSGLGDRTSFQTSPSRLREIRRFLPDEKTAVAEYYCGRDQGYLIFFNKAEFDIKLLPGKERLFNQLRGYLKCLQNPEDRKVWRKAAQRLGRELLSPYLDPQAEISRLIIVPDGILYELPFETLGSGRRGSGLIRRLDISYSPSSSSLIQLSDLREDGVFNKKALIFGSQNWAAGFEKETDSRHSLETLYLSRGFDFSSLPDVDTEVRHVARNLDGINKDVYTNEEATEEVFKSLELGNYGIIHFACHSFMDSRNPMSSALVLGRDRNRREDGFLQAREIQRLGLAADLVVMAGCRTGIGPVLSPEGMVGLPRVFFYAGARSVVSALWMVNDKASALFMRYFYSRIREGRGMSKALCLAKRDMLKSPYRHPFFWSGYVLYGDPQWPRPN